MTKAISEIKLMRQGGKYLAQILEKLSKLVTPGADTAFLNKEAESLIKKIGAMPSFVGVRSGNLPPFPCALCTSINEEIVHGVSMPGRELKAGDIVGLDLGLIYEGVYLDAAITVPVGRISREAKRLLKVTKKALEIGLSQVKAGAHAGDYAAAVEKFVTSHKLGVVKELVGHGVGRSVHEPPQLPNYGKRGSGVRLEAGMTLAFEPMVTLGDPKVKFHSGTWRTTTADNSLSAHFEHTVLVTEQGCEILTK